MRTVSRTVLALFLILFPTIVWAGDFQKGWDAYSSTDYATALAAEKGHAEAQYNLGVMHQNGWGVPVDEEEGIKWYLLAADQGIVGAQLALGRAR
jgi:TPR repeat protein